jgi:hypothetical protein
MWMDTGEVACTEIWHKDNTGANDKRFAQYNVNLMDDRWSSLKVSGSLSSVVGDGGAVKSPAL